jgi:hypothetical protein
MNTDNNILSGLGSQQMNYTYTPNIETNFDGILAVGDTDWGSLGVDQQRKQ